MTLGSFWHYFYTFFVLFLWKPKRGARVGLLPSFFNQTKFEPRDIGTIVCALSYGHGPRNPWFEGFCKTLDFHGFFAWSKTRKQIENAGWAWSDFGLRSSQPTQNDLQKNPAIFQGGSAQQTKVLGGNAKKTDSWGSRISPFFLGVADKRLGPIWGPAFCPLSWVIWRKDYHRKDGNDPLPPFWLPNQ